MNLLNKLTIKNLKLNKKRTIVTIIGIMLSVALITAVATMYSSALSSLIKYETYQKGNFHVAFYNVPINDVETIKNNHKVDDLYITKGIGYSKLENSRNEYKPYAYIMGFTKSSLENLSVKLVEGRLPENENEIVIPTHLKTSGRITLNVGDSITLNIGNRMSDGYELDQSNPYNKDANEEIVNTHQKTYKIVGVIERPASNVESYDAPGFSLITYINDNDLSGNVNVYTRYTKSGLKDNLSVTANILGVDEELFKKVNTGKVTEEEYQKYMEEMDKAKYEMDENTYLIILETNPFDDSSIKGLGIVVIIVCGIIVFTSVFCIKNSFDISITEKIKQYGMLRSIGATKKQIKRNVFYEAIILGIIGIILGVLFGFLASFLLVIVSNYYMADMLEQGLKLQFVFSWVAVLVAIVLGAITIYLSAMRSAKRASKVTPIDSIKNSANIKIKAKKLKSPRIINKLFGIGGDISYKNLKRNKKKYRTTVISIVVSVFIFIALSSFMSLAFKTIKIQISTTEYNISSSISNVVNKDMYDKVVETTKLDNIENYTIYRDRYLYIENPKYSLDYKKKVNMLDEKNIEHIGIVVVGDEQYKKYIKSLGLEYEDIKDKGILIDTVKFYTYIDDEEVYFDGRQFSYNVGDVIPLKANDDIAYNDIKIEIGEVTNKLPFAIEIRSQSIMVVSDEYFDLHIKSTGNVEVFYKSNNANKLQDDIDEVLKDFDYTIDNMDERVSMVKNLYTLIGIFLYGFIIVISLIGITNIFNTITTNMELRKQEFAMLKSVGMTSKEFSRMIKLESIFMGVKSLFFGIPIGIGLSYLIYKSLAENDGLNYTLPIIPIIISTLVVFLLISLIMRYSINKINKQNTIETIRNENI